MKKTVWHWALSAIAAAMIAGGAAPARGDWARHARVVTTPYYIIHTDAKLSSVREIILRMDAMFREYTARTRGWTSGRITHRLPFYVFRHKADYYAAGGLPGSAGEFNGVKLMAIAGRVMNHWTWHVIQHEGFHEFVYYVIRANIPTWSNEGMAEYFGEAIFTGDGYVTGIIPPARLARLKAEIKSGKLRSIHTIRTMSHARWNGALSIQNYDEAWSMIYFLAHADHGRYQAGFNEYLRLVSHGKDPKLAWNGIFGTNDRAFQKRWTHYWMSLPADPTRKLENKATVATLTSALARWIMLRKKFANAAAFFHQLATTGFPHKNIGTWLPRDLVAHALAQAPAEGKWTLLRPRSRRPRLELVSGGARWIGRFVRSRGGWNVQVRYSK